MTGTDPQQGDQPQGDQPRSDKPLTEQLKAKLDELEIERHLSEAAAQAEDLARTVIGKAGEVVHTNSDKITAFLDKAGASIDEKTDGKYADQVAKVRGYVDTGVSKIAERRPGTDGAPGTTDTTEPDGGTTSPE